jgi:hypothetical protein
MDTGPYGHIFAYGVLLGLLVEKVKESDPAFEDFARRSFDTHLGRHFAKVGKASQMEIEAREMFNAIISTPQGTMPRSMQKEAEKPLTWKRRIFNWLERG